MIAHECLILFKHASLTFLFNLKLKLRYHFNFNAQIIVIQDKSALSKGGVLHFFSFFVVFFKFYVYVMYGCLYWGPYIIQQTQ
jgi:hypothetical protein